MDSCFSRRADEWVNEYLVENNYPIPGIFFPRRGARSWIILMLRYCTNMLQYNKLPILLEMLKNLIECIKTPLLRCHIINCLLSTKLQIVLKKFDTITQSKHLEPTEKSDLLNELLQFDKQFLSKLSKWEADEIKASISDLKRLIFQNQSRIMQIYNGTGAVDACTEELNRMVDRINQSLGNSFLLQVAKKCARNVSAGDDKTLDEYARILSQSHEILINDCESRKKSETVKHKAQRRPVMKLRKVAQKFENPPVLDGQEIANERDARDPGEQNLSQSANDEQDAKCGDRGKSNQIVLKSKEILKIGNGKQDSSTTHVQSNNEFLRNIATKGLDLEASTSDICNLSDPSILVSRIKASDKILIDGDKKGSELEANSSRKYDLSEDTRPQTSRLALAAGTNQMLESPLREKTALSFVEPLSLKKSEKGQIDTPLHVESRPSSMVQRAEVGNKKYDGFTFGKKSHNPQDFYPKCEVEGEPILSGIHKENHGNGKKTGFCKTYANSDKRKAEALYGSVPEDILTYCRDPLQEGRDKCNEREEVNMNASQASTRMKTLESTCKPFVNFHIGNNPLPARKCRKSVRKGDANNNQTTSGVLEGKGSEYDWYKTSYDMSSDVQEDVAASSPSKRFGRLKSGLKIKLSCTEIKDENNQVSSNLTHKKNNLDSSQRGNHILVDDVLLNDNFGNDGVPFYQRTIEGLKEPSLVGAACYGSYSYQRNNVSTESNARLGNHPSATDAAMSEVQCLTPSFKTVRGSPREHRLSPLLFSSTPKRPQAGGRHSKAKYPRENEVVDLDCEAAASPDILAASGSQKYGKVAKTLLSTIGKATKGLLQPESVIYISSDESLDMDETRLDLRSNYSDRLKRKKSNEGLNDHDKSKELLLEVNAKLHRLNGMLNSIKVDEALSKGRRKLSYCFDSSMNCSSRTWDCSNRSELILFGDESVGSNSE